MLDKNFPVRLVQPLFDSGLIDLILELEHLRRKEINGTTHKLVFEQLKNLFHIMESVGSARIEGNNTTVAEYIDAKIEQPNNSAPNFKEISNIEKAMCFIEDNVKDYNINRMFVSELHKKVVEDLPLPPEGEGDANPGAYRSRNVKITGSSHEPMDCSAISSCMDELFSFINKQDESKYDLLKTAIAHHRFVYIHPFSNGNGRTARLFTYAMLVKLGFNVDVGRILNPTAVFCSNRNDYYEYLAKADSGDDDGILEWCEYMLSGLKAEIEKIDKLLDYEYLKDTILLPAIKFSLERQYITDTEFKVLKIVINKQVVQNKDFQDLFQGKKPAHISREIRHLIDKKMLQQEQEGTRKYVIRFDNNYLMRSVIKLLGDNEFLPENEKL